jgi:hypothetical protein
LVLVRLQRLVAVAGHVLPSKGQSPVCDKEVQTAPIKTTPCRFNLSAPATCPHMSIAVSRLPTTAMHSQPTHIWMSALLALNYCTLYPWQRAHV